MIDLILAMLFGSIITILCASIGFFCGWKLAERKKLPEINPVKIIEKAKEHKEIVQKEKKQKEKINQLNDILENINRYDGTGASQKPIKKG